MRTTMDQQSFIQAVWERRTGMLRLARSIVRCLPDAEDVVSEATLRAWEKLPSLKDEALFGKWLMSIVANCAYGHLRKQRRVTISNQIELGASDSGEEAFLLWDLVQKLPDGMREPIVLYYYEGYNVDEIAYILRVPRGTIAARMHRAKARLRQMLTDREKVW